MMKHRYIPPKYRHQALMSYRRKLAHARRALDVGRLEVDDLKRRLEAMLASNAAMIHEKENLMLELDLVAARTLKIETLPNNPVERPTIRCLIDIPVAAWDCLPNVTAAAVGRLVVRKMSETTAEEQGPVTTMNLEDFMETPQ